MLDIKLMAHPSRAEHVQKMLNQLGLPDSIVVWDDRPQGGDAMYTARKAWSLPLPDDCTHRLVLQDDLELCDNFVQIAEQISNRHPTYAISLINFNKKPKNPDHVFPYYLTSILSGCAIMLPKDVIQPCMEWCKTASEEVALHDDLSISCYCLKHGVIMITTSPSLVQHLNHASLLPYKYTWERVALDFEKEPRADWGTKKVYSKF